jgi:dynein heavy chain 1
LLTAAAQVIILTSQILWSTSVEESLSSGLPLSEELRRIESILRVLADYVLEDLASLLRKKCEQLITELVRQRDAVRGLLKKSVCSCNDFEWLSEMRFYMDEPSSGCQPNIRVAMANANFDYGFEYLGLSETLVQTPLTHRCYLTLTQVRIALLLLTL